MAITYNTYRGNPLYIFRATSGGTVFSTNLTTSTAFDLFTDTAVANDAIYFSGFSSGMTVYSNLYLTIGTALSGTDVVVVWEYYAGSALGWRTCHDLTDGSNGFTTTGDVVVKFPVQARSTYNVVNSTTQNWIRCRMVSLTSITEGGAIITNRVQCSNGDVSIDGYTDASPCTISTLYTWILANAPELGAYKWGNSFYKIDNIHNLIANSTLRMQSIVLIMGNGCYAQSLTLPYIWSGTKYGTDGWFEPSYIFLITAGPSNQIGLYSTSRFYGGAIIVNTTGAMFTNIVDGLVCTSSGYGGLGNGDIIGVYSPRSGYFSNSGSVNRCIVEGGLITASAPTAYPTNLQISYPGSVIWALYGNALNVSDVVYTMPPTSLFSIGANYYVAPTTTEINFTNPNPSFPGQTTAPRVMVRNIGHITAFPTVYFYDDSVGTYTDYTTQASDATLNDVPLSGDTDDCLYFRVTTYTNSSSNIVFDFTTPSQSNDYIYAFEYYNASTGWTVVPSTLFWDTSLNLTKSGTVYMGLGGNTPATYQVTSTTVNSVSGYWFRMRIVTPGSVSPVATTIKYRLQSGVGNYYFNEKYNSQLTVLDINGDPVNGATVTLTDSKSTVYSLTTDSNGETTSTDIKTSQTFFDPINASDTNYNYTKESFNPFTLTISKTGYETYTSEINIISKFYPTITLKSTVPIRQTIDGKLLLANQPETGSSAKLLEM